MLNGNKKVLFRYLYCEFKDGKRLFSLTEIIAKFSDFIDESNVKSLLLDIEREDLIDLIFTDRKGEGFAYILLKSKGNDYFSEKKRRRKEIFMRIALAVLSAVITFVAGRILYKFF